MQRCLCGEETGRDGGALAGKQSYPLLPPGTIHVGADAPTPPDATPFSGSAPGRRQMQRLPASHACCALAPGTRDAHSYEGVASMVFMAARRGRKAAGRGSGSGRLRRGTRVGLRSARLLRGSVRARWRGAPGRRRRGRPDRTGRYGVERRADESPLKRLLPRTECRQGSGGGLPVRRRSYWSGGEGDHPDSAAWLRRAGIP